MRALPLPPIRLDALAITSRADNVNYDVCKKTDSDQSSSSSAAGMSSHEREDLTHFLKSKSHFAAVGDVCAGVCADVCADVCVVVEQWRVATARLRPALARRSSLEQWIR